MGVNPHEVELSKGVFGERPQLEANASDGLGAGAAHADGVAAQLAGDQPAAGAAVADAAFVGIIGPLEIPMSVRDAQLGLAAHECCLEALEFPLQSVRGIRRYVRFGDANFPLCLG